MDLAELQVLQTLRALLDDGCIEPHEHAALKATHLARLTGGAGCSAAGAGRGTGSGQPTEHVPTLDGVPTMSNLTELEMEERKLADLSTSTLRRTLSRRRGQARSERLMRISSDHSAQISPVDIHVAELAEDVTDLVDKQFEVSKVTSQLANERTLLAWIRTMVSVFGWSVTLGKLGLDDVQNGRLGAAWSQYTVGVFVASLSLLLFGWGVQRYFRTKRALRDPDVEISVNNLHKRFRMYQIVGPLIAVAVLAYGVLIYHLTSEYT